jgi:hypothetical protein
MDENLMDDFVSTSEIGLDSQELAMGVPFASGQGFDSQELFDTILGPSNDPMLPAIGSQLSDDGCTRQKLTVNITPMTLLDMDGLNTPSYITCNTADLNADANGFSLTDYVNGAVSTILKELILGDFVQS